MHSAPGIVTRPSPYPVSETLDRLTSLLQEKGITVFCRIDHSGEAEKLAVEMPATQLLIFGSPKAGTPVMLAAPLAAIDLPLKVLAWADTDGNVSVSYNSLEYIQLRFGVDDDAMALMGPIDSLLDQALA